MPTVLVFIYLFCLSTEKFQEVLVRFTWLGPEEDEWIDVCKGVRLRSLQCVAVLPGDLILCFQVVIILKDFCSPDLALESFAC